jgi:hypothetical protein
MQVELFARVDLPSGTHDQFGIKRLPHLSYSPDLAPYDFWRFGYLKPSFEGRFFDDDIALE